MVFVKSLDVLPRARVRVRTVPDLFKILIDDSDTPPHVSTKNNVQFF